MSRQIRYDISTVRGMEALQAMAANMQLSGKKPIVVFVQEGRTLDQNALSFALYEQIAAQAQDRSIRDVRHECKLTIGIPILRAGSDKFRAMYDKSIKGTLTHEEKLDAMDWFPVTRLMTKKQFTGYLDEVVRVYSQQGYSLLLPGEESYGR